MDERPNFENILDKKMDDIKPPSPLPGGTFLTIVDGPPTPGVAKTGTNYHEYAFRVIGDGGKGDIDAAQLQRYTEDNGPVTGKVIKGQSCRFYLSGEASYRYKDFLTGPLNIDGKGKSLREAAAEAPGRQVLVTLRQVPSQDGTRMYHEVAGMARV